METELKNKNWIKSLRGALYAAASYLNVFFFLNSCDTHMQQVINRILDDPQNNWTYLCMQTQDNKQEQCFSKAVTPSTFGDVTVR